MDDAEPDDVGTLGEEAARFLGALSGWDVNEHLATGAPECLYCPVCRVVHAVRDTSPEVRAHLAVAGAALLQAAAGLLAAVTDEKSPSRRSGLEHIDLEGDGWPEGDET